MALSTERTSAIPNERSIPNERTSANTKYLHTWVYKHGTTNYLDYIKKTWEYSELVSKVNKIVPLTWALDEWTHELTSIKGNLFEDAQGTTLLYGEVSPIQIPKTQNDIAIEMAKRIIVRSMPKYIPIKHTLFYQWLKEVEETEEGIDFVDAVKIYCNTNTFNKTIQDINSRALKWLRAFFHVNNPE
jgi:hypothetical protein